MTDLNKNKEGIEVTPTCCCIPEEHQAESQRRTVERKTIDDALLKHLNACPLGCGVNYEKGRCKEGDELFEKQEAVIAEDHANPLHCQKAAEWHIQEHGASYDDYTYACTDHVGYLLSDAPSFTITPYQK